MASAEAPFADSYSDDERGAIVDIDAQRSTPTEGPLKGLGHLARVATVGYRALVAETSEPIRWLWHGVVSEANHVELTGPSGGGKTTLATMFVAALANPGTPVALFGREVTPIRPGQYVVFVEEENGKHSVRKKAEAACLVLSLGIAETLDRVIFLVRRNIRVGGAVWNDLLELGKRGHIGAVFIDSRARVLRNGESNSEEDQAAVADALFALIEASKAPAFVVSHTRKGGAGSIEDVAGSNQRGAGADVILLVDGKRDTAGRVLSSTVTAIKIRDDVEEHPDPIEFTIGRDAAGAPTLTSNVAGTQDAAPLEDRILRALSIGPQTKSALATLLGRNKADLEDPLTDLFAAHRIRTTTKAVNGREFKAFALAEITRRVAPDEAPDPVDRKNAPDEAPDAQRTLAGVLSRKARNHAE
jgi:energy-coupling factor transporter ATP-binding protein EcfA2